MAGILCLGYDTESGVPSTTRHFLKTMTALHRELNVPCSLFITGKNLEKNLAWFRPLADQPLFDLQQHTFSHLIFKQIRTISDGKDWTFAANEPSEKVQAEVQKTNELFSTHLHHSVTGLTTPYCFYQGLSDRPDLLQVLWDQGIRFIRSYGRNEFGYNPLSLDIQPFFYADQGFPELLECPVQGWQDCIWRDRFGWHANWERQVFQYLDYIADHNLYYGLLQHD